MFYREYPPPPQLAGHVQCFWALEHDYRDSLHTHEHLWADTQTELIFSYGERYYRLAGNERCVLPENFVIGPFKKELLLYSTGLTGFVAVRFHPWGLAAFSKRKMTGLINAILLTYETGYADQAHFSHNFREMFGYTPAEFKSLIREWKEKMSGEQPDVVFLQDNP